ncbi:unnamed protein product, partial [Candidula unifasciata]
PKPVKKKKKFINKKQATTFRLIPGYHEDEDAPPKVQDPEELDARKEEQRKYGIFYDDAYNYMKHLRSLDEQATLVVTGHVDKDFETQSTTSSRLPTFVEHFSTDATEEDDIDPEILAALDDAPIVNITDEDNLDAIADEIFLDDDFIEKAGGAVPVAHHDEEEEEDDGTDTDISDEEEDENTDEQEEGGSFVSDEDYTDEEDKLSSAAPSRGRGNVQDDIAEAQTALILKNFEEGLGFRCGTQLSDDEEEMPTAEDYENLKRIIKEDHSKPISWSEFLDDKSEKPKIDASRYLYEDEDEYEWKDAPAKKPFDCVSILSLSSNTRNRPTDIIPPKSEDKRKHKKSEGSDETSSVSGINLRQLQAEMRASHKLDKAGTFRPKDETVDEKKSRKKAIKEERKERRQEKKANREVFAMENEKMKKETAALSKSVKSIQIF